MIANLRIVEGEVAPSDNEQTVKAIVGSKETTLTFNRAFETAIEGETVLQGTITERSGIQWRFLLFRELGVGAAYNGSHTQEDALRYALPLKEATEKQLIGECCG